MKKKENKRITFTCKTGCLSKFTVHFKKAKVFEIADVCNEHNHPRSDVLFKVLPKQRQFNESAQEFLKESTAVKGKVPLVREALMQKTKQFFTLKDLHNQTAKMKSKEKGLGLSELELLYSELKNLSGATVEIFTDDKNQLEGIYFQDNCMKQNFNLYPELILVDATYRLNDRRMPLFVVLNVDGNGESQIAALFIIKSENYSVIMKMFNTFKKENEEYERIDVILSDKNFPDRKAYADSFPKAKLSLCIFHVIQNFNREITTRKMDINIKTRNKVLQTLEKMIYSETENEYNTLYEELRGLKCTKVTNCFDKNWHSVDIRKQWTGYSVGEIPHFMNRTTNRVENFNQKLKQIVTKYGAFTDFFKETLQCVNSLSLEKEYRTIVSTQKIPVQLNNEAPFENSYRTILTAFAFQKMKKESQQLNNVAYVGTLEKKSVFKKSDKYDELVYTNEQTCTCSFRKVMLLPCRHMLKHLDLKGEKLFNPELCHIRWLKSRLPVHLFGESQRVETKNVKTLTQMEKFKKIQESFSEFSEKMAEKPSNVFWTYLELFEKFKSFVNDGAFFSIEPQGKHFISSFHYMMKKITHKYQNCGRIQ